MVKNSEKTPAAAEAPQSELATLEKAGMRFEFITSLKVDEPNEMALGLFRVIPKAQTTRQTQLVPDSVRFLPRGGSM